MTRSPFDPTTTLDPEPWENQAACVGRNPDWWFSDNPYTTETARTICAGCPVRLQCLAKGMGEEFGMFGGLTGKERRKLAESVA